MYSIQRGFLLQLLNAMVQNQGVRFVGILCFALQNQEHARLKGDIRRVGELFKQNPFVAAIRLLAGGKPEIAPAYELDDLASQYCIRVYQTC